MNFYTTRENTLNQHDQALANWPNRAGEAFGQAMLSVISTFQQLLKSDIADIPPIEISRTYRWLGDAYVDYAQGKEENALMDACDAYWAAEKHLDKAQYPLDEGKLCFNHGNAFRGLSEGKDLGFLEPAEQKYVRALQIFKQVAPELVAASRFCFADDSESNNDGKTIGWNSGKSNSSRKAIRNIRRTRTDAN